jgi:hypothetical protein
MTSPSTLPYARLRSAAQARGALLAYDAAIAPCGDEAGKRLREPFSHFSFLSPSRLGLGWGASSLGCEAIQSLVYLTRLYYIQCLEAATSGKT